MEKMLVTTDFSDNSKAGIHFAIQLSMQRELKLIFLHVNELSDEPDWIEPEKEKRLQRDRKRLINELETFVSNEYLAMGIISARHKCAIHYRFGVVNSILDYAAKSKCGYICLSTRGAGPVTKFLGTNTGNLIEESTVPVLCIPASYTPAPVTNLLYASDLTNYKQELISVLKFAEPINASVNVLHISSASTPSDTIPAELVKKLNYPVKLISRKNDSGEMAEEIENALSEFNPSLVVLFTKQDRSFLELLFQPSTAKEFSFRTKFPLLIYSKSV